MRQSEFHAHFILFVILSKHNDLLSRWMQFKNCMRVANIFLQFSNMLKTG